ncbi:MAG: SDR family NAD(P)-dependent oxidoreductase, partial [Candidatus Helarchaeota archaeon]
EDFPVDAFDKIIALNLRTPFLLTKHAIKLMKTNQNGGNIVHFVSSSAKNISYHKAPYGTAKAGLAHFIHYAASEGGPFNIKVNGISPTYVFTSRHEREIATKIKKTGLSRDEIISQIFSRQLLKKAMVSQDLIEVTELLATTDVITGQIYNCSLGEILSY